MKKKNPLHMCRGDIYGYLCSIVYDSKKIGNNLNIFWKEKEQMGLTHLAQYHIIVKIINSPSVHQHA